MDVGMGRRSKLEIFGDDYNTRDGTCIRDFIHIMDLADAHSKALNYLLESRNTKNYEVFNLGTGIGTSIFEAISAFEIATSMNLNYSIINKRKGDVVAIYADYQLAQKKLNWKPQKNILDIMKSAWNWEINKSNPK